MQDPLFLQQLRSCELFRELNENELSLLYASMIKVHLKAGDVLVTQGEASDSMHVLLSGRLLVKTANDNVVGQISRGQTVGEMGLITQEPRSATVVALRDCLLLQLDGMHFNQVCEKHPGVLLEVTKMITRRLQRTLQSAKNHNNALSIAIFSGHPGVNIRLFIEQLRASFDKKFRYKVVNRSDFSASASIVDLYGVVQTLENQYDFIFYDIGVDREWREFCLDHIDHVYVVVDAGQIPEFDPEILAILKSDAVQTNIKKVLVLLHDAHLFPLNTADWLRQIHFSQHHHIEFHQKEDFARLLRFMNGSAVGLVLGGGGTRSWAHLGAIKYLFEENIPIDAYAGTSAGAIGIGLLSISRDYQDLLEISQMVFRAMRFNEYTIPFASLLSSTSLTNTLKRTFGTLKIEDLKKMLFCVAADLVSSSEVAIHQGLLWRAIRSSASLPGIYPPVYGDGRLLVDGAVVNNLPVDVMRNYFEGFGKIIAIDISGVSSSFIDYDYPLDLHWRWVLRNKIFSRRTEFKLPSITVTVLKGLMLSSTLKSHANLKMSDVPIKPVLSGYGLLDVSRKEELLQIGYDAAKVALKNWQQIIFNNA